MAVTLALMVQAFRVLRAAFQTQGFCQYIVILRVVDRTSPVSQKWADMGRTVEQSALSSRF